MGIDIRHEIFIAFLKSILWFVIYLWYLCVILVVVVGVQIYLAKKYKITTIDDFVYFVLARIKKDNNPPILYLTKDKFPKDFVWRTPIEFVFDEIAYSKGKMSYKLSKAFALLYTAVELSNSSEVTNSDDLKKYISEPSDLVGIEAKSNPLEALRTSWLGSRQIVTTFLLHP